MPISGWIVGTASDTLAMSVENVGSGAPASSASKRRPSASALSRYACSSSGSVSMCEYTGDSSS